MKIQARHITTSTPLPKKIGCLHYFYFRFRVVRPLKGSLYWHTGSSGSENVFRNSGTVLLTNAHVQPGRRQSAGKVRVAHHGENRPLGRPLPNPDDNVLNPDQGPGLVYESSTRPPLAGNVTRLSTIVEILKIIQIF